MAARSATMDLRGELVVEVSTQTHTRDGEVTIVLWLGPNRSVELTLECSPEEAIIEVTEPSICVYDMVMRTPLACDDRLVKKAAKRVKELEAALTTNTESQAGRTEPPPSDSKDEL